MIDAPPVPVAHMAARTITAESTAYTPCSSGTVMADGTRVRWGSVASNWHPLGTRIRLTRRVNGRRVFTVRDRIGSGSQLDFFMPSCQAGIRYGRRVVRYRVMGS